MDDIEVHERLYRGSDEEARDLKGFYTRFHGDMEQCVACRGRRTGIVHLTCVPMWRRVFCWLCCSRLDLDSHRFMDTLKAAIDAGPSSLEWLPPARVAHVPFTARRAEAIQ